MPPQPDTTPPADALLSRAEARTLFRAALAEPTYAGKIYYLIGSGGIGKSHELRLIHTHAKELYAAPQSDLIETGIIDLAHTRYQQPLLLLNTFARRITRSLTDQGRPGEYFADFFAEAERYLKASGAAGSEGLEEIRTCFLNGYRAATNGRRLLITIDTFERLDARIPEVERYSLRRLSRLETWLIELLRELPNSLIVVAGRVRPRQEEALRTLAGDQFARAVALQPLTAGEVKAFVEYHDMPVTDRDEEWYERMYAVSGGMPVRLIVALEIARACKFDPDHLPPSLSDPDPDNTDQLGHDFAEAFVGSLYNTNPALAQLIEQAFYLRKGLWRELLEHIGDAEPQQIAESLDELQGFGFVKVSGDGIRTLHDEVYDLLLNRLNPTSANRWLTTAIDFLTKQQQQLQSQINRTGMSLELLGRLRMAQVDRLYYQLATEPVLDGYQNYCELSNSAIFTREEEFDAQLQDELARFFDETTATGKRHLDKLKYDDFAWERICYDEAVRWVLRYIRAPDSRGGGSKQALILAEQIAQDHHTTIADDPLAWCHLETFRLEALGFEAATPEAIDATGERYAALIQQLQHLELAAAAAPTQRPIHAFRQQQSRFLRAYALNNWGYLVRGRFQLNTAIRRYTAAITLYKTLNDETVILRGTSLTNLSFALRLQGDMELALVCADEAITLLHRAGARYREISAHNTRARILLDLDDLFGAEQSIRRATALLADFPGTRNQALAANVNGAYERWRAYKFQDEPEASEAAYEAALTHYQAFKTYFDQRSGEPERRIEARQGLGCTYRSRGTARLRRDATGSADLDEARRWFREALDLLNPAMDEASTEPQVYIASLDDGDKQRYTDLHEDLANTYALQQRYAEALAELNLARQAIPPEFNVQSGAGAVETAQTREQKLFWLQLAKIEFLEGICRLSLDQPHPACEHLLQAFASGLRFSPKSYHLHTFRTIASRFLRERYRASVDAPSELRELRQASYLSAQRLGVREAFFELEQVFETVDKALMLL